MEGGRSFAISPTPAQSSGAEGFVAYAGEPKLIGEPSHRPVRKDGSFVKVPAPSTKLLSTKLLFIGK